MEEEKKQDNEFEYNDGLGDMLRAKETDEFSWLKTSILLIAVLAIIIVFFILSFNLGKKILFKKDQIERSEKINKEEVSAKLSILEEEEEKNKLLEQSGTVNETSSIIPSEKLTQDNIISYQETQPQDKILLQTSDTGQTETSEEITMQETTAKIQPKPHVKSTVKATPKTKIKAKITASKVKKAAAVNQSGAFKVIVGSFNQYQNAKVLVTQLKHQGVESYIWIYRSKGTTLYRVQVGSFENHEKAASYIKELEKLKIAGYVIKK